MRFNLANVAIGVAGVLTIKWMIDQAYKSNEKGKTATRQPPIESKDVMISPPHGDSWVRNGPLVTLKK